MSTQDPPAPPVQEPLDAYQAPKRTNLGGRVGLKVLARFCHNVGTGLHAGVDARRVFETEASRGSMRHRNNVMQVRDHIAQGGSVSQALHATQGYFPPLLCEMVEVGERSGRLEQVFLRLGEYYEQLLKLRRTFLQGVAWPLLQLVMAIGVIGLLILIMGMISDPPPFTILGLYGVRGALIYFGVVGVVVGSIAAVIFASTKGLIDLQPLHRLVLAVPFLGNGFKTLCMSRLVWALSMTTDTDLSAKRAVELAVRATQSSYYTRFIAGMLNVIGRGRTMHDAFETTGVYPPDFLDALQTGEISGQISETMEILSHDYEDRVKTFFRMLTMAAGALVWMMVAGFIIFMIFTLVMKVYIGPINEALQGF